MIKRPLVWMLTLFVMAYIVTNLIGGADGFYHPMDDIFEDKMEGRVEGTVYQVEQKEKTVAIYLKKAKIFPDSSKREYRCSKILIYFSGKSNLKTGNKVAFSGQIVKFQPPSNLGQFNELAFYKENKIDYKMYADKVKIIDPKFSVYYHILGQIRKKIWKVYCASLDEKEAGVVGAMMLGEKSLLGAEIKDLYQENGISHILSISGLHISMLGLSLYKILRRIGVHNIIASSVTAFCIFSYGCLTDFSVSTNRAVVMMMLMLFAGIIGRTYDIKSSMAFSALIIMFQNPLQMYNSGFLLSFSAIIGLAYLDPAARDILKSPEDIPENGMLLKIKLFLKNNFITSYCVNLITLPIILYFFYSFPPYSVFMNLIILPFMSLLMFLALIGGVIGSFSLKMGQFFLGGVHYILKFYENACEMFLHLPFHIIITGKPGMLQIIVYFLVLGITFFLVVKFQKKRFFLLLTLLAVIFLRRDDDRLEITFLDVGQGDAIFMETPSETTYLVDGGSLEVKQLGKYRLLPFLKARGTSRLDYVIVTHMDNDHISGLEELFSQVGKREFSIGKLCLPDTNMKDEAYMGLVNLAEKSGIDILYIKTGDKIKDGKVRMECLHPQKGYEALSKNSYSTVLGINYGDFDLLLTGDVQDDGEKEMLEAGILKDYDVLKVAHHGSDTSTSEEFLNQVKPEVSIISCGRDNPYGHPHKKLLERLRERKCNIFNTSETGAVTIKTDGNKMEIEIYRKEKMHMQQ